MSGEGRAPELAYTALPAEMALAEIERGRGTQFDPDLAAAFLMDPPPSPAR